jgi:hypothetical protein
MYQMMLSLNKVSESQIPLIRDQRVHNAINVPLLYNSDNSFALIHSLAPLQRPCKELQESIKSLTELLGVWMIELSCKV